MDNQKIDFERERDFGEIIGSTFEFLRQNFKPLGKLIIIIVGPFILLSGIFGGYYQKSIFSLSIIESPAQVMVMLGLYLLTILAAVLVLSVLLFVYIKNYQESDRGTADSEQVWIGVKKNALKILLFGFGYFLIVLAGIVIFILPGIFLSISLVFVLFIGVKDNKGFADSVRSSLELVRGHWWVTCILVIVLGIIQGFLGFIFQLPQFILSFSVALNLLEGKFPGPAEEILMIITGIISSFILIFYSVSLTGIIFHYYSLLVRKKI